MPQATARQQPLPPVDAARAGDHMLTLAEVEAIMRRKKSWIYAEVRAGRFPAPDDGRWYASEVAEHIAAKRLARLQGGGQDGG